MFNVFKERPKLSQEEKDAKNKKHVLPQHVNDLLYTVKNGQIEKNPVIDNFLKPTGLLLPPILFEVKNRKPNSDMWWSQFKSAIEEEKTQPEAREERAKNNRPKRKERKETHVKTVDMRQQYYDKLIRENKFNKLAFVDLGCGDESLPEWVVDRVKNASASARFELPFDKRILEHITPLQYLTRYVRLYRYQTWRYTVVYTRFKSRTYPYMEFEGLYSALNSMFGDCLYENNFKTIKVVLDLHRTDTYSLDVFLGICAFVDRLFWTFYVQKNLEDNTYNSWHENRSALEAADMESLKRKLDGFNLSREMRTLLFSLG